MDHSIPTGGRCGRRSSTSRCPILGRRGPILRAPAAVPLDVLPGSLHGAHRYRWRARPHGPHPAPPRGSPGAGWGAGRPRAWRRVDVVLSSHSHWDHLDYGSLRLLGQGVPLVVPLGMGARLRARGFREVVEVVPGDDIRVVGLTIEATRALHRGFGPPIGPTELCVGYIVHGSRIVYFAGDTAFFEGLAAFDRGVELALIPVWGWGPRARATEHLDPHGAAQAVRLIRPRIAVPIHWGTLHPIGLARVRPETRVDPPHEFARLAATAAPGTIVRVVPIGGSMSLDGDLSRS
ncbi:MAG: MBL fold metallo-hydrolase [Chloroflexi bacterium]|nr:MBL fold metallo-hydrolase [Chloroflexota bacterium]